MYFQQKGEKLKKYISVLRQTALFAGMADSEIEAAAARLNMRTQTYERGKTVYHSDQFIHAISILAVGQLMIQKDDYWGNRSVVNRIGVGEVFGEAFAMQEDEPFIHDVIALEDSVVLSFGPEHLFAPDADKLTKRLVQNLLCSMAAKNRMLAQKIDSMAHRTTREKLTDYLSAQSQRAGSAHFSIPFNRQQLADYLGVDRSAMCTELGKMRDEGLLAFHKCAFDLYNMDKS